MAIGRAVDPRQLARLNRKFEAMAKAPRAALREAIRQGGEEIAALQAHLAPRGDTGRLAESNQVRMAPGDLPAAEVVNTDPKAHLVEFGTAPHAIAPKKGKAVLADVGGQPPAVFGKAVKHPGTQPQPFFFPAYRALKRRVVSRMARASGQAIEKAAKGG